MLINITIPIHNEEMILEQNTRTVVDFCHQHLSDGWFIVLADNASTDKTRSIGEALGKELPNKIKYLFIPEKGKGGAIKAGWTTYQADSYIFMDADLSTNLKSLPNLIAALKSGADIAIGSRYATGALAERSLLRKIISKIYRALGNALLHTRYTDIPCGFKGISQDAWNRLCPLIKDTQWFFDTELLYRANQLRLKIKEIPVVWTETLSQKRKSKVGLLRVSINYLQSLVRLRFRSP